MTTQPTTQNEHDRIKVLNQATEAVDVSQLKPHPENPNRGNVKAIRQSISTIGWFGTVLAQKSSGRIIAGEHRWRAAKQEGATTIQVTWIDVDDSTALRIMVADNELSSLAKRNDKDLANVLMTIQKEGHDLAGLGISDGRLEKLLAHIQDDLDLDIDGIEDDDDALDDDIEAMEPPKADIRQVMLFLSPDNHGPFLDQIDFLKGHWDMDNNTDAIVAAVSFAANSARSQAIQEGSDG